MKVLQVHNIYAHTGGEEVVLELEEKMLQEERYIDVIKYIEDNNSGLNGFGVIESILNFLFSLFSRRRFRKFIQDEDPDIIHFHNVFPKLGPGLFKVAKESRATVIVTLHNYRYCCSNALFLKNGSICTKCLYGIKLTSIFSKCYRNSYIASLIMYVAIKIHKLLKYYTYPDIFIVMTGFAKNLLIEYGVDESKIIVKPHSTLAQIERKNKKSHYDFIFIGRLSKEKGIDILIDSLNGYSLAIIGDGQLRNEVLSRIRGKNISFLGWLKNETVVLTISKSKFLVFPSVWFETFGLVIIEAFSVGKPVIARDIGGISELIVHGVNGFLFKNDDELEGLMKMANELPESEYKIMCDNAYKSYEKCFSHIVNKKSLISIYKNDTKFVMSNEE